MPYLFVAFLQEAFCPINHRTESIHFLTTCLYSCQKICFCV